MRNDWYILNYLEDYHLIKRYWYACGHLLTRSELEAFYEWIEFVIWYAEEDNGGKL